MLSGMLAFACGCHHDAPRAQPTRGSAIEATTRPSYDPIITQKPLATNAQPTLIKQGKLPLVYLVEAPATLRFVDLTNGAELGRALAKHGQIVSFDERRGVMLGETVIRSGPFTADHNYGIWVDPELTSEMRDTHITPRTNSNNGK